MPAATTATKHANNSPNLARPLAHHARGPKIPFGNPSLRCKAHEDIAGYASGKSLCVMNIEIVLGDMYDMPKETYEFIEEVYEILTDVKHCY